MPQLQGRTAGTRLDLEALAEAVTARASSQGISMRELAHELGLTPSTLTRIRQGHRPDAEALAVLLAWVGLSVEDVLSTSDPAIVSSTGARTERQKRPRRPEHR